MTKATKSLLQDGRLADAAEALGIAERVLRDPQAPHPDEALADALAHALKGLQAVRRGE